MGVKAATVREWIRTKKLPAMRIGKQYRITTDHLSAFERQANESAVNQ